MAKPLEGVRVVDLSTYVAAPVCARLLADMGAEVIKVERPEGDAWRVTGVGYHSERYSLDENPVFDIYNSGKKHIALNLKTEEGMAAFHRLLKSADVFVTNTRPAALKRLGLSYEDLKDLYPSLVYGIVLGYGEKGPDADKPAFDTSAFWARCGFLRDQAPIREKYEPVQPPYSMGDTFTGVLLMGQICAALLRREKTGKGDLVRSSLFHNGIFSMGTMAIINQSPYENMMPRDRASWGAPSGSYQCADGEWIFISGYSSNLYPPTYEMLGLENLAENPKFAEREDRWENRYEYYEIIRNAFLQKPSTYWLEKGRTLDLPITRMGHYSDLSKDEQAWANGYLEEVVSPNGRVNVMPSSPIEMESVGELTTKVAPAVGADTDVILSELGYTAEQIKAMTDSGAVK